MKLIARIATAPDLDDPSLLDPLLSSEGWQTLMAIADESGMLIPLNYINHSNEQLYHRSPSSTESTSSRFQRAR